MGLWEEIGPEAAAALQARAGRRRFARGAALMHSGQVPSDVLILLAGRVKVSAVTPAGRHVLLALRGPGELVGELSALDRQPRSATVAALEAGEALVVPHDVFRAVLGAHPEAALGLLRVLAQRLREADAKRVQLAGYTAMGRVAFCLLELSERFDELPLSQDELAGWAGASLESVGRSLRTMRDLGWIETRRRGIRVLDADALRGATA